MKVVMIIAVALVLAGCAQQRAQRAYETANQNCQGTQDYNACMNYHAAQYQADQARRSAAASAYTQMYLQQTQPQPRTMTNTQCHYVGTFLNCTTF